MQLIIILLLIVGILTFLSGAIVFFGSAKKDRARSIWFFAAAIFSTIWMGSIAAFLWAKPTSDGTIPEIMHMHVSWTFVSAILLDATFLGYSAWNRKYGKPITLLFLALGLALCTVILSHPSTLYNRIIISSQGNGVGLVFGPVYFLYVGFFCAIVPVIMTAFLRQFSKARSKRSRNVNLAMLATFGASSTVVLVFNLILPLLNRWGTVWLGPLALGVLIMVVYYMVLRYQALNLSAMWLRLFSYIVIVASIAIVYMVIFAIIFAALFRGSTPSLEVIILNFIMVLIFIALMPAMNGLMKFIRSLIMEQHPKHTKEVDFDKSRTLQESKKA